jgi:hypothetical protein
MEAPGHRHRLHRWFCQHDYLPLAFFQRRDFHQRALGISAMDSFAVMPQVLHRKPFGLTGGLRAFRPRMAIAVHRHAFDTKLAAALAEFGRPVARSNAGKLRQQQSLRR